MPAIPAPTLPQALLLLITAVLGGGLNSVAGGGSFLTFPALLFVGAGLPAEWAKIANATSTIALWPGTVGSALAYRDELERNRRLLLVMGACSLAGGLLGALLLVRTPASTFSLLVPWLLLLAALLFSFGSTLTKAVRRRTGRTAGSPMVGVWTIAALQMVIAVYGGYFGGGIGIMMLASLALLGMEDIHAMNAIKTVLASAINGVAVLAFIAGGLVSWPHAAVMIVGGIAGGFGGASLARRLPPAHVRRFVMLVAYGMTLYFFLKQYAGLFR
jgi:uncharacterized membrane protein YfcA